MEAAEWHDGHLHSSRNPTIWSQGFFAGTTGPVRQFKVCPLCWLSSPAFRCIQHDVQHTLIHVLYKCIPIHQKIISIRFTPKNWFKSIQFGRSTLYCWVMKSAGVEMTNWCLDTKSHFSCLCACCCSIDDSTVTVKYCIQTPSCGQSERSDFLENRIDIDL